MKRGILSIFLSVSMVFSTVGTGGGSVAAAAPVLTVGMQAAEKVAGDGGATAKGAQDTAEPASPLPTEETAQDRLEYAKTLTLVSQKYPDGSTYHYEKITSPEQVYTDEATGYQFSLFQRSRRNGQEELGREWMAEITGGPEEATEITIPKTVQLPDGSLPEGITDRTVTVASIGVGAFLDRTEITSVTLDGILCVRCYAFRGCTGLKELKLPASVDVWGDNVFAGCTGLQSLEIEDGLRVLGYCEFKGCTGIKSVTLPASLSGGWESSVNQQNIMGIKCRSFEGCTGLESVTFEEGIEDLTNSNLFPGCTSLKSVTLPSSVRTLHQNAFLECDCLEEIILPEGLEEIGPYAFKDCSSLKRLILPSTVRTLERETISGCKALQNLYILSEELSCYALKLLDTNAYVWCDQQSNTWETAYKSLQDEGKENHLKAFPEAEGIAVEPYTGIYDEKAHPLVSVTGTQETDEVIFQNVQSNGSLGEKLTEIPQVAAIGDYPIQVTVHRLQREADPPMAITRIRVTAQIQKLLPSIRLKDMMFAVGTEWEPTTAEYVGDSSLTYLYYRDAECKKRMASKPTEIGTYYVVATSKETAKYQAGKSEPAKLEIVLELPSMPPEETVTPDETAAPGETIAPGETTAPDETTEPDETAAPDETTEPGSTSSAAPNETAVPGETTEPGETAAPGSTSPNETTAPGETAAPGQTAAPGSTSPVETTTPTTPPSDKSNGGKKKVTVKKVVVKKAVSNKKKTITVQWKKVSDAAGYQVVAGTDRKVTKGKKTVTVKKAKTIKATVRKLKSKKKYYVKVRAYKIVDGKKHYGSFSNVKMVKVK